MANALNVNLVEGQKVEMNDGRIVTCKGGFGMMSFTSGTALFVETATGERIRVSSHDVKKLVD